MSAAVGRRLQLVHQQQLLLTTAPILPCIQQEGGKSYESAVWTYGFGEYFKSG
jgi:hypothetical protein